MVCCSKKFPVSEKRFFIISNRTSKGLDSIYVFFRSFNTIIS